MKEEAGGKCKIIERIWEYLGNDTYGYRAECSCGETITDWWEQECEEKVQEHLKLTQTTHERM